MAVMREGNKVVTNEVRASYAHVFEPKTSPLSSVAKYQMTIIIPKTDVETINLINQAIANAEAEALQTVWNGQRPVGHIKTTFYDGDAPGTDDPNLAGCMYLRMTSTSKPGILRASKNSPSGYEEITSPEEFYSGCYCIVSTTIKGYNASGSKGITAYLDNILFVRDGEAFSGRGNAISDFAGVEVPQYGDDESDFV